MIYTVIECVDYGDGAGTNAKEPGRQEYVAVDSAWIKVCKILDVDSCLVD